MFRYKFNTSVSVKAENVSSGMKNKMDKIISWMQSSKFLFMVCLALVACHDEDEELADKTEVLSIPDWTDASHGNNTNPAYDIVFPQDKVNTLEITMPNTDWTAIQSNMTALYGAAFGAGGSGVGGLTFC